MKQARQKQWLCLLLSVVTVLSMMSGCMEQPAPSTSPATTQPVTTAEPTTVVATTVPATTAPAPPQPLEVESSLENGGGTIAETVTLQGTADPRYPVTVNGVELETKEDGSFSCDVPLEIGENTITVGYLDATKIYRFTRRYTTEFYSQQEDTTLCSGASLLLKISVRAGSTVKASFRGEKLKLEPSPDQLGSGVSEGFELYTGKFELPNNNNEALDLGVITYTVTSGDVTETITSGKITCQPKVTVKYPDKSVTPEGGGYINVGSGYIVEIVDGNVETFHPWTNDDRSYPTYNYLPEGTVDYGNQMVILNDAQDKSYLQLRCGVRVYRSLKNTPITQLTRVVNCYTGTLPDHNEIGVAEFYVEDHFTYLNLDCLWKAPFYFDFEEQEYEDASIRRFRVEKFDASYVDIRFCYATQVSGLPEIPEDHPLFSSAEWINNEVDHTLRLHLKKEGGLYGWSAYYNEEDQLVFKFLNPITITAADNAYGADLTGVRIMLDVGHGGVDIGALGRDWGGAGWTESERNLVLAFAVKEQLESIGATVVMNRVNMEDMTTQRERMQFLRQWAPDFCLCVHHNSSEDKSRNGYETGTFTIFSQPAGDFITDAITEAGIYRRVSAIWYYYNVCRQTVCPIVLSENGHMTNITDLTGMLDEATILKKAQALTQGIANYYLDMNGLLNQ